MSHHRLTGRYLITGGAGFVGSHLAERLLNDGCQVVVVDNLITGDMQNVRPLLGNPAFEFIEHDITVPRTWDRGFAGIFHMASPASPVDYARHPIETLRVGSEGTEQILKLARDARCKILVASTSEIYGDPLVHPQVETYWGNVNSIGPRSCYDEAKRYLEAITMAYQRVHSVATRIVRIFNTYGPRMRMEDGRVVPNFCVQAVKGEELTVYGHGQQTRSFCYVDDLVEGLIRTLASDYQAPINLGNPNEITIREFADRIISLSGKKLNVRELPLPEDDPKTRRPDISVAKKILGWEPKIDLQAGLEPTYAYFQERCTA